MNESNTVIDYLGFRLIAITILPINAGTLRYGSCDAGVTIHCEDPTLKAMMKQAARKMHLRVRRPLCLHAHKTRRNSSIRRAFHCNMIDILDGTCVV